LLDAVEIFLETEVWDFSVDLKVLGIVIDKKKAIGELLLVRWVREIFVGDW
jgi:hypothetical protein